jgi:hypothetical protein
MSAGDVLFLILLALIVWLIWRWLTGSGNAEKPEEREPEEAERQRRAAEAAAWRVEVAEDKRKGEAETEKARRLLAEERAARIEQERRDRQAAEAEARRRGEADRARLQELEEAARRKAEEARARQQGQAAEARRLVEDERASIRATPIAGDIHRDMREFLSAGHFFGEEHSPLAYVGYKVGKTHGLPPQERRRRLRACFQIDIPPQLAAKYQTWGPPVTSQRFSSMCQHITMLADMRRERRNYEVAVSDWEADVQWLAEKYGSLAQRLHNARIG